MNKTKKKTTGQQILTLLSDRKTASEFVEKHKIAKLNTIYTIDHYRANGKRCQRRRQNVLNSAD